MSWIDFVIATNAKTLAKVSTTLGIGAGATWPGEIALTFQPTILSSLSNGFRKGIIIVAGTNGKTTTALMITTILEAQGYKVIHNASGANLLNGIVSSLINKSDWSGRISADWGVFEVDENSLPAVISNIQYPISKGNQKLIIVLLNLFRDQLDRYGEVDVIAQKWGKALQAISDQSSAISNSKNTSLIANADDPLIVSLSTGLASRPGPSFAPHSAEATRGKNATAGRLEVKVRYFGLDDPKEYQKNVEHATDSTFCPHCGARLTYEGYYYSHIGVWKCKKCKAKRPPLDVSECEYPLPGLYNRYNTLAAVATCQVLDIKQETINKALAGFTPAFGRQEEFIIDNKKVKIFLSKNPTGFNQSLRTVMELGAKHMFLVLNDRIPDGRDVSWIWDVDFEMLAHDEHVITVSGDRTYDLALRLKYANLHNYVVEPDLKKSLQQALANIPTGETLFILATYSAMLDVRKIVTGKKIL